MTPAFPTAGHAWRFIALLLVLLLGPVVTGWIHVGDRRDVYATIPAYAGPSAHIQHEIFVEEEPLDIAFIGSSFMWSAIDALHVQEELTQALGRPAHVTVLASVWPGIDRNYWFVDDLLERRRVGMVVLKFPNRGLPTDDPAAEVNRVSDQPHVQAFRYYRVGDPDDLGEGGPFRYRAALYAGAVLGLPRHLLSLARPNYMSPSGVEATLGARLQETGYYGAPFVLFRPPVPTFTPGEIIRAPGAPSPNFRFYSEPLPGFQEYSAQRMAAVIRDRGVPAVFIHIPQANEITSEFVEERVDWSEHLNIEATLVGVPPRQLFAGLSEEETLQLFASDHLNSNGAAYFTRAITPALVQLYVQSATRP